MKTRANIGIKEPILASPETLDLMDIVLDGVNIEISTLKSDVKGGFVLLELVICEPIQRVNGIARIEVVGSGTGIVKRPHGALGKKEKISKEVITRTKERRIPGGWRIQTQRRF